MPNLDFFKSGPDLQVRKELPLGLYLIKNSKPQKAVRGALEFHLCLECGGWIEGAPFCQVEDDRPEFIDGRRGRVIRCRRMGHELAFFGVYNKEVPKIESKPKVSQPTVSTRICRGTGGIGG